MRQINRGRCASLTKNLLVCKLHKTSATLGANTEGKRKMFRAGLMFLRLFLRSVFRGVLFLVWVSAAHAQSNHLERKALRCEAKRVNLLSRMNRAQERLTTCLESRIRCHRPERKLRKLNRAYRKLSKRRTCKRSCRSGQAITHLLSAGQQKENLERLEEIAAFCQQRDPANSDYDTETPIDADLDGSSCVDLADLQILQNTFGLCTDEPVCFGDFNGDRKVNLSDTTLLLGAIGTGCLSDEPRPPANEDTEDDSPQDDLPPPPDTPLPGLSACSDGIDNDSDGAIDYPEDPGCLSEFDTSEDSEQYEGRIQLSVHVSQQECIAPCGVLFDASDTTSTDVDEPFHQLDYHWDYGDTLSVFLNQREKDANTTRGPLGAHVFDPNFSAGERSRQFTTVLTVQSPFGAEAQEEITVTIKNPLYEYADETYCLSATGNFTGCPSSDPANHIQGEFNQERIQFLLQSTSPRRLLLRRGETYVTDLPGNFVGARQSGPYHLGAYGTGDDPVIFLAGEHFFLRRTSNITISHIHFQSDYNPRTGLGRHPTGFDFFGEMKNILVYRCKFSNLGFALLARAEFDVRQVIYADNAFSELQNYTHFGQLNQAAIIGNKTHQTLEAISGDDGKCGDCTVNFPDHGHTMRIPNASRVLIHKNSSRTFGGWSSAGHGHQSSLRLGTSGYVEKSVVSDNRFEGGFGNSSMSLQNSSMVAQKGEAIYERNEYHANRHAQGFLSSQLGGTVIRNNLFIKQGDGNRTEIGSLGSAGIATAVYLDYVENQTDENRNAISYIYNNTVINFDDSPRSRLVFFRASENGPPNVVVENNLVYSPFLEDENEISGVIDWNTPLDTRLQSANNLYYGQVSRYATLNGAPLTLAQWQANNLDNESLLEDPQFQNAPETCDTLLLIKYSISNSTAEREGPHTRITAPGTNFSQLGVYGGSHISITSAQGGPSTLDCNLDDLGDTDYTNCHNKDAISASGETFLLAGDILSGSEGTLDFDITVSPSTRTKLYLNMHPGLTYAPGKIITERYGQTPYVIESRGSDAIGDYITLSHPLEGPMNDLTFICLWKENQANFAVDYRLAEDSPAIDAGVTVDVHIDFDGNNRELGTGVDIGAFEH